MSPAPVAIVGAGPYGLSLAAHLGARQIDHRIFGRPMQFWNEVAAAGGERYLQSYCFGTSLSAPVPGFTLPDYNRPRGLETLEPCSMANFAAYGHWFQHSLVPWVEPQTVARVTPLAEGFALVLADGQRLTAKRVVIAIGLASFAYIPPVLAALPAGLVIHTSQITSFASFRGRSLAVVGGGQSALEAAALLNEAGAQPHLVVREPEVLWYTRMHPTNRSLWRRLRSPISVLGTGPKAWALAHVPGLFQRLPEMAQDRVLQGYLLPKGAWWLRNRVENRVPIATATTVVAARETNGRVALELLDATSGQRRQLVVDHVVAGSGYDVDVDRMTVLDPLLRAAITRTKGAPRLNAAFETNVPGLHFAGTTSAGSFGPMFRFVAGADHTARTIGAHVASRSRVPQMAAAAPEVSAA